MEHQKALESQLKSKEVKVCQKMVRRKVKMHCLFAGGGEFEGAGEEFAEKLALQSDSRGCCYK